MISSTSTIQGRQRTTRNAWSKAALISPLSLVISSVVAVFLMFSDVLSREASAGVAIVWMLILMGFQVPVGIAIGIAGGVGALSIVGVRSLGSLVGEVPFTATATSTMTVLPMFILMGLILWRAELTSDLYQVARMWLSRLPGGLAVTTNVAGAGLGAVSGSTMGIAYALGRIGVPEMLKEGYDKRIAVGSVMSSGTIAQLIPPSILLIIYAGFTETPAGQQLAAGIVPGILLTLAYCGIIVAVGIFKPSMAPRGPKVSVPMIQKLANTLTVWPIVLIVVIIVGGMGSGLFTTTEAGAVAALVAIFLAFIRKGWRNGTKVVVFAARDTLASVGSLLFLLICATLLNRYLALSGAAQWFTDAISAMNLTPLTFAAIAVLFYLILGMFMDPIPMMLLTVPLLLPTAEMYGFNAIWFGVFVVLLGEIAIMSPPVGVLSFVIHRIVSDREVNLGQEISLVDVYKAALIFLPGALAVVVLIVLFPAVGDIPGFLNQ